ncbi:MAG: beta-CASP ribonuclease aCPSF1 [Thermoprotei archaeon]|nr:MAG: beta-CASP ribonuclease aCPSF1 [Thermoprotei archaeon]
MIVDKTIEKIRQVIFENIPLEARITKIEFEGPTIVIYTANPQTLFKENKDEIIKKIVKTIKKRIAIRTDPEIRKNEAEARKIIESIVPPKAEITNIYFDHEKGEVEIEAKQPGYVIGKDGMLLNMIFLQTYWRAKVLRAPPLPSKTVSEVRQLHRSRASERKKFLREVGFRIHRSPIFKLGKVRIVALGGFGEVGRSAILVQTPESNVLLDMGIKPSNVLDEYPYLDLSEFDLESLDAVILTHAHLDHIGFVPYLYKYGYRGPIYTTEPTLYLMKLLLEDYIEVNRKEGKLPLYSKKEIAEAMIRTIPLKYEEVTDIAPGIRLTLHNSGHVLGSAIIHLHIGNGLCNIVYTSDFKFGRTRLFDPAIYKFPRVEVLIMESTYGGREDIMPPREETERMFIEIVKKTIERGGRVLVPVLAVGRAQEIMLVLADAIKRNIIPETPVFIEGMISEATAIHTAYPEYLARAVRDQVFYEENPFMGEFFEVVKDPSKRQEIAETDSAIILATSGMLTGGPVMEYLRLLAPDSRNSLIFVSYQVEGTLGRRIMQGLREIPFHSPEGRIEVLKLNMEVFNVEGFSGHSDRRQLLRYIEKITPKPETIILNHGERRKIRELASTIRKRYGIRTLELSNTDAIAVR